MKYFLIVALVVLAFVVGWYLIGQVGLNSKKINTVTNVMNNSSTPFAYALYFGLTPLQLKVGERKTYQPTEMIPGLINGTTLSPITIEFINVDEDRRSYTGTVTGPAVVNAHISIGDQSSTVQFHFWSMNFPMKPSATGKQGGVGDTIAVGPYQVYLVSLLPYSKAGEIIDSSQYVATFMVDTIHAYETKQKAIDLAQAELAKRAPNDASKFYATQLTSENNNNPNVYKVIFNSFTPGNYFYWMDVDVASNTVTRFEHVEEPTE